MATIQRPQRGSRISTFYPVKNLPSLSSLDSAFQLQEYISLVIRLDVHDVDTIVTVPGKGKEQERSTENDGGDDMKSEEKDADRERKTEIAVDEACWIYEQLRRLAQDLSHPLITMLQQECTRASCPEMKAGEWLYLCVAHGNDGAMEQCCAIDYILHTLDSATALLNSPRAFPSRLSIPQTSHRHFSSLARRLGRIFAHAYFHHREAFEQAEAESSLYARFLALTSKFDLVPAEFLVIPPRLTLSEGRTDIDVRPPRLLAAAIDPQGERNQNLRRGEGGSVDQLWDRGSGSGSGNDRPKSKSPPGLGSDSPRKVGRNRTYTMVFSEAFNAVEELSKGDGHEENVTSPGKEGEAGPSGLSSSTANTRESFDEESAPTPTAVNDEISAQQPSPSASEAEKEPATSPIPESITLESAFDIESPVDAFPVSLIEHSEETPPEEPPSVDLLSEIIVLEPEPLPEAPALAAPEEAAASDEAIPPYEPAADPEQAAVPEQGASPEHPVPEAEATVSVPEPTPGAEPEAQDHLLEAKTDVTEPPATTEAPQTTTSPVSIGEITQIPTPEPKSAAETATTEETADLEKPAEPEGEKHELATEPETPPFITAEGPGAPIEPTITATDPKPPIEVEASKGSDSLLPHSETAAPAPAATEDLEKSPSASGSAAPGDA